MIVSSGRTIILDFIPLTISSRDDKGKSVLPTEPLKRASPVKTKLLILKDNPPGV